ncbi:hypothetical protein LIER_26533 [Lithospermum erythrorhizon]|uniref:Reverse transcriptase domain-containing protein n=1 Tax=Lithospermum erythrorhizon TaxID=34254 RepID=A0AAV3R8Q1_LITER
MEPSNSYKEVQKLTGCLVEALVEIKEYLGPPKERYLVLDKAAFSLVVSARKLKDYFESHPIQRVTNQPLNRVLISPSLFGCLTTWAVELGEFEISYIPKTSVKAQTLADFVIECTARAPPKIQVQQEDEEANSLEITMEYALRFSFPATNNEAEYEAMIVGLKLVRSLNIEEILLKGLLCL